MEIAGFDVLVERKKIKNIHLAVYPPHGHVRIACPVDTPDQTIRLYIASKAGWLKRQQKLLVGKNRQTPRQYVDRETHYFLGKPYLLRVRDTEESPSVKITNKKFLDLHMKPGSSTAARAVALKDWYRAELKRLVEPMIIEWEKRMGVQLENWQIKSMRTKWGSCNPDRKFILLNLELAKKPIKCIEYIVVHELVHLFEHTHNESFVSYMNKFLPRWKSLREELNNLPVSHVDWGY